MGPLSGLRRRWRRTGRSSRVADGRIRRVRRRAGASVRFSQALKRGTGMNGPLVRHWRPGLTPADSEPRRQSWPRRTRSGRWAARGQVAGAQVGAHSWRKNPAHTPSRARTAASSSGTSNRFRRDVAPETSTTSRVARPRALASSFATAALAAPSAGAAVTRRRTWPSASKPSTLSREARGVTRTQMRDMGPLWSIWAGTAPTTVAADNRMPGGLEHLFFSP